MENSKFHCPANQQAHMEYFREQYKDTLGVYHQGLLLLTDHMRRLNPKSLITIGSSSKFMLSDLAEVAKSHQIQLPEVYEIDHRTGQLLYNRSTFVRELTIRTMCLPFDEALIVEDFADSGRKIQRMYEAFAKEKRRVNFVLLTASESAQNRFKKANIQIPIMVRNNKLLFELLYSRKTPDDFR